MGSPDQPGEDDPDSNNDNDTLDAVVPDGLIVPEPTLPVAKGAVEKANPEAEPEPAERPNLTDSSTRRGVAPKNESPPPFAPPDTDGGTSRLLTWLLGLSPFLDLHQRSTTVCKDDKAHAWRCNMMLFFDVLFRLAVIVVLLGIIIIIAWKTLSPLPPFFEQDRP